MATTVITDSASSLPRDDIERLRIGVVPLYVIEGDRSILETGIDLPALYARLPDMQALPTTSQPSPTDFADAFDPIVERGDDVLAVLISDKMSSTLHSAEMGAELTRERYSSARITLVDSESNSMQEGFAVLAAAECAEKGGSLAQCEAEARATVSRSRFLFAPRSLEYLARGGRISGAAKLLGSILRIVPILTASDGTTGVAGAVRTHEKALARMAALMHADVQRCGLKRAVVQSIMNDEEATRFAREVIEPITGSHVPVIATSAVVGIHVGPAIGLAYETVDALH
ncbi:MAG: DegV family protein [Actinomycetota bacterium]|jgi:DegV family protein with EDD domain|nr:DegV family protein [Actinomycetota bacterium]